MPRLKLKTELPNLSSLLPQFSGFAQDQSKRSQMVRLLKKLILSQRKPQSQIFYPLREIAEFFHVSIRTANLAILDLKHEGLLISARGSHVRIPGANEWSQRFVKAVIGMPIWVFGIRYSHLHKFFPTTLSEILKEQDLLLDTIIFSEVADRRPLFENHLMGHRMDFTLWLFPFAHNRSTLEHLEDSGIPQLIIHHGADPKIGESIVEISWENSIREVLTFWATQHQIRKIVIPIGTEYRRKREKDFERIASRMGFQCETQPCTPERAQIIMAQNPPAAQKIGIALLDEHSTAEFCFFSPDHAREIFTHHRVLFANNSINIPYVPDQRLSYERIHIPQMKLGRTVNRILQKHLSQSPLRRSVQIQAMHDLEWPLHRYI